MAQDNWIIVEDGNLPEILEDVLASHDIDGWIVIAHRKRKNWYNTYQDEKSYDYLPIYPTHWQPLPKPPNQ